MAYKYLRVWGLIVIACRVCLIPEMLGYLDYPLDIAWTGRFQICFNPFTTSTRLNQYGNAFVNSFSVGASLLLQKQI